MDALILCGYRPQQAIGLKAHEPTGRAILDVQIERVQSLGLSPIVVLAGRTADDYLRQSLLLKNCELAYDDQNEKANLFSNVQSGLRLTDDATFALPVEVPVPPAFAWKSLKMELTKHGSLTQFHLLQLATPEGAPWHYGFPLLVSLTGRKTILEMEPNLGLCDERLRYCHSQPDSLESPIFITGE
jgi:hypothetical protein